MTKRTFRGRINGELVGERTRVQRQAGSAVSKMARGKVS